MLSGGEIDFTDRQFKSETEIMPMPGFRMDAVIANNSFYG
jgi:hypothetical protein